MRIEMLPANAENAEQFIAAIRPADLQTLGPSALESLRTSLARSFFSWVIYVDDKLACVWGMESAGMLSNRAYMWLALTPVAEAYAFALIRRSQLVVQALATEFEMIEALVEVTNRKGQRWLHWLGFRPGDEIIVHGRHMRWMELCMADTVGMNHTEVA